MSLIKFCRVRGEYWDRNVVSTTIMVENVIVVIVMIDEAIVLMIVIERLKLEKRTFGNIG